MFVKIINVNLLNERKNKMRRNYIYNIGDKFIDQKRNLLITHRERIIGYTKSNPNVAIKVYTTILT